MRPLRSEGSGVAWTLGLSLLARVPLGALGLLLVLEVRAHGFPYALAGLASAACALGMAASAPLLGRLSDRLGMSVVLLVSGIASMLAPAAFLLLPDGAPAWPFPAIALVCGLTNPPVSACARALWRQQLSQPEFNRIVMIDASLQEVAFIVGPLAFVPIATYADPALGLALIGATLGLSTIAFALRSETRGVAGGVPPAGSSGLGPLVEPGVLTLVLLAGALGMAFGATELGIVGVAESFGIKDETGLLYAAWGAGSLAGGLAASRAPLGTPAKRLFSLLSFLSAASALLAAAPNAIVLALLLVVAGLAIAPVFGLVYSLTGDIAPSGTLTEAFSLETAAITAGLALGAAVAGLVTGISPAAPFVVAAVGLLAGALSAWRRAETLHGAARAR